ncbi:potassium channel protein [Tuberibacillus sp. Marseille-P3662]|uniref:potassium channel protein n=1 Tax=Tuberibacillus sp. Marseille-P3662 TaxID=1965358 RepID=UPI000A1C8128|nr:potassium channel family protein [Tuberibacillus sp. Marseille-P3662]
MFQLMKKIVRLRTWTLLLYASILYICSSYIIYYLEPTNFKNPFNGFWWVMTTVTTVGFGDFYPVTIPGKIVGICLYLTGIGVIGIIIGKIVDVFGLFRVLKVEGKLEYKGTDHFVIVGWSEKSKKTINEILFSSETDNDIVLIDTLDKTPIKHERVHFIQGEPTVADIMDKANILKAKSVSIFTPDNLGQQSIADGQALLIASAVESYGYDHGRDIYTIVEVTNEEHVPNFEHVKINEFILSNEAFPFLMAKSMLHKGTSQLFMQLLSNKYGDDLWVIEKQSDWTTYEDAFEALKDMGASLIADGSDFGIIRRLKDPIPSKAKLYIICNKETYKKIEAGA